MSSESSKSVNSSGPMTPETRTALLDVLTSSAEASDQLLDATAPARQLFADFDMPHVAELYKIVEFTALLQFDLAILFADYVRHEIDREAHVYARFVILTIVEGGRSFRGLLGKGLQEALEDREESRALVEPVRAIHKDLHRVTLGVEAKYGDVRNGIAAHRDAEAVRQLRRLRSIGGEELAASVLRFLEALAQLHTLLSNVTAGIADGLRRHGTTVFLPVGGATDVHVRGATGEAEEELHLAPDGLTWTSSNPDVAKVLASGRVQAISPGYARISFRSRLESGPIEGSVGVVVADHADLPALQAAWRTEDEQLGGLPDG